MTEEEVFAKIIKAIAPIEKISLDTEISSSRDFSSLGLLNLLTEFKPMGIKLTMRDLLSVNTVGDLVKLIASRSH